MACLMSPRKKVAQCSQGALNVMHVMFFSRNRLVLDHPMPVGTMVSGPYYCLVLQDKMRLTVSCKHPELLERGAILLEDSATHYCHRDVQNVVEHWGLGILLTLHISPHVITGCLDV
jgi:hypothetical protein